MPQGIGDYGQYPCPVGHYCLTREDNPVSCPGGTYRNDTGAGSVHECHLCPAGFQCGTETITPEVRQPRDILYSVLTVGLRSRSARGSRA